MWRRYGDVVYALLLAVVVSAETVALAAVTWAFMPNLSRLLPGLSLLSVVIGAVAVTAMALLTVTGFVLALHAFGTRKERLYLAALEAWADRWIRVVVERQPRPPRPIGGAAVDALLDLREVLRGAEGDRVKRLVSHYGVGNELLSRAMGKRQWRLWRVARVDHFPRSTRTVAKRLEALEALAKARLPEAFPPMLELLADPQITVRLMALRGLARTLARLPKRARPRAAADLCEQLRRADLPGGAIEESLLLLEDAAPLVLRELLKRPEIAGFADEGWAADDWPVRRRGKAPSLKTRGPGSLLRAALEATGRLQILELGERVGRFAGHGDPEAKAAALRALWRLGYLPAEAEPAVVEALRDEVEFVRIQAVHAAVLLPTDVSIQALWERLGDPSWWVRRGAGDSLVRVSGAGVRKLKRAAKAHPDRYARQMAVQILLDAGHLDGESARKLREAG